MYIIYHIFIILISYYMHNIYSDRDKSWPIFRRIIRKKLVNTCHGHCIKSGSCLHRIIFKKRIIDSSKSQITSVCLSFYPARNARCIASLGISCNPAHSLQDAWFAEGEVYSRMSIYRCTSIIETEHQPVMIIESIHRFIIGYRYQ